LKDVEREKNDRFRVKVYFALIPCREIENLKEKLIDNKRETIHIYNKSDVYGSIT